METFLAVLLGLAFYIGIPVAIGLAVTIGLIALNKTERQVSELVCATSADCPPGYICTEGRCVPQLAS